MDRTVATLLHIVPVLESVEVVVKLGLCKLLELFSAESLCLSEYILRKSIRVPRYIAPMAK